MKPNSSCKCYINKYVLMDLCESWSDGIYVLANELPVLVIKKFLTDLNGVI